MDGATVCAEYDGLYVCVCVYENERFTVVYLLFSIRYALFVYMSHKEINISSRYQKWITLQSMKKMVMTMMVMKKRL